MDRSLQRSTSCHGSADVQVNGVRPARRTCGRNSAKPGERLVRTSAAADAKPEAHSELGHTRCGSQRNAAEPTGWDGARADRRPRKEASACAARRQQRQPGGLSKSDGQCSLATHHRGRRRSQRVSRVRGTMRRFRRAGRGVSGPPASPEQLGGACGNSLARPRSATTPATRSRRERWRPPRGDNVSCAQRPSRLRRIGGAAARQAAARCVGPGAHLHCGRW